MSSVIVLGGFGFFGAAAVARLRADGLDPMVASRRPEADLRIDVEHPAGFRAGDIIIDAVGPFQTRTTALVEAAIKVGFDVIDISDSPDYARRVRALGPRIDAAGIRVLTSCSSVSAISAACVRLSGIAAPERVTVFLAPATRHTANSGVMQSLLSSLGREVDGRRAWSRTREFPMPEPVGRIRGFLLPSADAVLLPPVWPSLRRTEFYVDTRTPVSNAAIGLAARVPPLRRVLARAFQAALPMARLVGASTGGLGIEVDDVRFALCAGGGSYYSAVAPAVLAARAILEGRFPHRGLVSADRYVEPQALVDYIRALGIRFERITPWPRPNCSSTSTPGA